MYALILGIVHIQTFIQYLRNRHFLSTENLQVVDSDPSNALTRILDTSQVQKVEMSDEDYSKRTSTVFESFVLFIVSEIDSFHVARSRSRQ